MVEHSRRSKRCQTVLERDAQHIRAEDVSEQLKGGRQVKVLIQDIHITYNEVTTLGDSEKRFLFETAQVEYHLLGRDYIDIPGTISLTKDITNKTINEIVNIVYDRVASDLEGLRAKES